MDLLLTLMLTAAPPAIGVDDLVPGQRGECQTVFEGDQPEPMAFVVKGVMRNFLGPNKNVVVIRLLGDKPEWSGVVAGMSGSPCSIDGKLVGALAYSFAAFAKEPIAGITPIADMLEVQNLPETERPWRATASIGQDWGAFKRGAAPPSDSASSEVRAIATPLAMAGVPAAVAEHFGPWLRAIGFEPVVGGAMAKGTAARPLVPGGAVAAVLVTGDVDVAATGTVTTVDGDRVLAFGHPFLGAGMVSLPMANATIVNTMVSAQRSYKMAVTGALVGEVIQDRLTAIGGRTGVRAAMLPVRGKVKVGATESRFSFDVARDVMLTPRFVAIGTAGALVGRVESAERGTVRLAGRIDIDGMAPVRVENVYAAERDGGLFINAAIDMAMTLATLWDTPFGPPPRMQLSLDAAYDPKPTSEWIEGLHVDRGELRPGNTAEVAVRLRRAQGGTSTEKFLLAVPHSWADQTVEIVAAGAVAAEDLAGDVDGEPRPIDLKGIGAWLSGRRPDGRLYLMVVRPGAGLMAGAEAMSFLPGSAVAVLSGDPSKARRSRGVAWEEQRARPGVVSGKARIAVRVLPM
ncbi:MAG: hypothetical protein HY903_22470 [Deltaproteobacteria bacterium]|nr:hypothetical protein [Deltaproteobacteria bacterium]